MKNDKQIIVNTKTDLIPQDEATMLISQAINKGVDVETMGKLLEMRRQLREERAREEFNKAMAAFQAACPVIKKTKEVKDYSGKVLYRYAPIESIVEQVKEHLKENGFSYATTMDLTDTGVKVCITVTHIAGFSKESCMPVPLGTKTNVMSASQQVAAASTFAKRYAFLNAFGLLTGDEDNDGAEIKHVEVSDYKKADKFPANQNVVSNSPTVDVAPPPITTDQKIEINKLVAQKGKTRTELEEAIAFLTKDRTEAYSELTYDEAEKILIKLKSLPDKKKALEGEQEKLMK